MTSLARSVPRSESALARADSSSRRAPSSRASTAMTKPAATTVARTSASGAPLAPLAIAWPTSKPARSATSARGMPERLPAPAWDSIGHLMGVLLLTVRES